MADFPDETLQIFSGTTTAWLSISTRWLSIAACSSQIYAQRAGRGGNLIAFDPLYGQSIIPSAIPCLPTEVTSSWYQSNPSVTTLLGPTFVCPGAYSAVQTIFVNSQLQQLLCCPSSYTLNVPITGQGLFPSQCTSLLSYGQTITYESTTPAGPWGPATSTVPSSGAISAGPTVVFAMHVNGFNFVASQSQATANASTTSTGKIVVVSETPAPSETAVVKTARPIAKGLVAAIAVGVVLAILLLAVGGWFVFRLRKRGDKTYNVPILIPDTASNRFGNDVNKTWKYEMETAVQKKREMSVHELAAA